RRLTTLHEVREPVAQRIADVSPEPQIGFLELGCPVLRDNREIRDQDSLLRELLDRALLRAQRARVCGEHKRCGEGAWHHPAAGGTLATASHPGTTCWRATTMTAPAS